MHESLHHYDEIHGREHGLYSTRGQVAANRVTFRPGRSGTREDSGYGAGGILAREELAPNGVKSRRRVPYGNGLRAS